MSLCLCFYSSDLSTDGVGFASLSLSLDIISFLTRICLLSSNEILLKMFSDNEFALRFLEELL